MTIELPESSKGDVAHLVAKAAISAVPIVGSPAAEFFAAIIRPPLAKRLDQWVQEVTAALNELCGKNLITIEDLQANDAFVSAVLQATQIAMRNHQDEKRAALRNAVINTALRKTPEDSLREMFLSWIGDLTVHHLILLQLFRNPQQWFKENGRTWPSNITIGGLSTIVEHALPELVGKRNFYDQVWNDLNSRGLVNTGGLHTTMSAQGMTAKRTSELGDSFLDFISP